MAGVANRLTNVRQRLDAACAAAGRPTDSVRLLAVSKTFGVEALAEALAAGQHEFGESYLQEAAPKIAALPRGRICWHYIGPLQSNKTREVAALFDWVQSIDRVRIAERLSSQRPAELPPLQVCVQVNISGERSKSGCAPGETLDLCRQIAAMPRLALRGLMAIPAPTQDPMRAREPFARLRRLHSELYEALGRPALFDTLSAGMSDDLEAAIMEGSTLVRVGTAIFGSRG